MIDANDAVYTELIGVVRRNGGRSNTPGTGPSH
jgi:hypothetical protein